jgi:alkaline phosphatase
MAPANEPLFAAERTSSTHSDERAAQEDDALLGNQRGSNNSRNRSRFWREVGLFSWAVIATAAAIVLAVYSSHLNQVSHRDGKKAKPTGKRNLIFMVSDGMGPASLSMTRSFRQYQGTSQVSFPILGLNPC